MECDRDGHENADKVADVIVQISMSVEEGGNAEKAFANADFLFCAMVSHFIYSLGVFSLRCSLEKRRTDERPLPFLKGAFGGAGLLMIGLLVRAALRRFCILSGLFQNRNQSGGARPSLESLVLSKRVKILERPLRKVKERFSEDLPTAVSFLIGRENDRVWIWLRSSFEFL